MMAMPPLPELEHVMITPLQPLIGAEITGIDLATATVEECRLIRAALLRHKVIFFHDQMMDRVDHVAFGRKFGELEIHPLSAHPEHPEMLVLDTDGGISEGARSPAADFWHTDTTFRSTPSAASILLAHAIPPLGGDTLWCNTVAVYNGLDRSLKDRIDKMQAFHSGLVSFSRHLTSPESRASFLERHPPQLHPVVAIHPETGERMLYVNSGFTTHIDGVSEGESRELLALLYDEVKRPEYQVRFRWRSRSIAFWDNRSTQHYGVADYNGRRHLERVTVVGTRPVGSID